MKGKMFNGSQRLQRLSKETFCSPVLPFVPKCTYKAKKLACCLLGSPAMGKYQGEKLPLKVAYFWTGLLFILLMSSYKVFGINLTVSVLSAKKKHTPAKKTAFRFRKIKKFWQLQLYSDRLQSQPSHSVSTMTCSRFLNLLKSPWHCPWWRLQDTTSVLWFRHSTQL